MYIVGRDMVCDMMYDEDCFFTEKVNINMT